MTRPKISIDIDDVIANSTEALRLIVNERTGVSLTTDDYFNVGGNYWGYYERVWRTHGLQDEVSFIELSAEMAKDQSRVPVLPGAEFAIHELAKRFQIIFITSRDKSWERETRTWFNRQFKHEEIELYFCENHKNANAKTKGELCKDLNVALHIDDNVANCQSVINEGLTAILFGSYGWQAGDNEHMVQCRDWSEVMEYINNAFK